MRALDQAPRCYFKALAQASRPEAQVRAWVAALPTTIARAALAGTRKGMARLGKGQGAKVRHVDRTGKMKKSRQVRVAASMDGKEQIASASRRELLPTSPPSNRPMLHPSAPGGDEPSEGHAQGSKLEALVELGEHGHVGRCLKQPRKDLWFRGRQGHAVKAWDLKVWARAWGKQVDKGGNERVTRRLEPVIADHKIFLLFSP